MDEVGGEEVGDRGAVASVQDRARLSSFVQLRLLGEGDRNQALLVGRGRRPIGRLQLGQLDIVDERGDEKAGTAVGAEAAVAQMLAQGFGRARHSYPRGVTWDAGGSSPTGWPQPHPADPASGRLLTYSRRAAKRKVRCKPFSHAGVPCHNARRDARESRVALDSSR